MLVLVPAQLLPLMVAWVPGPPEGCCACMGVLTAAYAAAAADAAAPAAVCVWPDVWPDVTVANCCRKYCGC